jgi:MGT family glycosyltransferase
MATYLLACNPIHGHVTPVLEVARHLAERGHRVVMLTGARFADRVAATGAEFRALRADADYDDRDVPSYLPDRDRYRGVAQVQYDIQTIFVKPIPGQYASLRAAIDEIQPDAVAVDSAFAGVGGLLFRDAPRPPVVALGVLPLTQSSRDVAPAGLAMAPSSTPFGRLRNRVLNAVLRRGVFRRTQRLAVDLYRSIGLDRVDSFVLDISRDFDRFLELCAPSFEYPRTDLSDNVSFVGPMPSPSGAAPGELPAWWSDLDGSRPVVHVTQGTIDNLDLTELIGPTIAGLSDLDALVVVSLGGRPLSALDALGPLPANVRTASYLPYDLLLPLTSVVVTNGGFGGVQSTLRAGVPLVVAGAVADKPEVAARVAWSGVGVDLRSGRPAPAAVRSAVETVLTQPSYRSAARAMADEIATFDTLALIERELAAMAEAAPPY